MLADVTERERLAKNVRDLRQYMESIIQNMYSGLVVVDEAGRVAASNPMAEQILGEPPGSLEGRAVRDWFGAAAEPDGCIARSLAEGARVRGAEGVVQRADGKSVPVAISSSPLVDADGTRTGAVVIFPDVSELVQLQSQVLHTEKMASLGRLAAGVAHEINNPMGFVHANLAQMEEYLSDVARLLDAARSSPERFASLSRELDAETLLADFGQAIRESQEGSERIRHIVQDLRAFAYRDDGEWVAADLNRCLDSTAHIVWTMMKHSVVLQKEYAELPAVRCHPKQLEQVFMNLLVNAYQAIEARIARDGGGNGEIVLRTAMQRGRGRDFGLRRRRRHRARTRRSDLRALLHHQGGGRGDGPRPLDLIRDRAPPRRHDPRAATRRRWHDVRGVAAAAGTRRASAAVVSDRVPTLLVVDDEARDPLRAASLAAPRGLARAHGRHARRSAPHARRRADRRGALRSQDAAHERSRSCSRSRRAAAPTPRAS